MATTKRKVGRPRNERPTVSTNFRIEEDLLQWIDSVRFGKSRNQFMNDLIRERAKL